MSPHEKTRSFRMRLALRAGGVMALALVAISIVSVLALREVLDREIDATVLAMAAIQAASLTDGQTDEMHFHDWELTPDEAIELQDLVRYAQVWEAGGESLLRSQYMTSDLPVDPTFLDAAASGELSWTTDRFEGVPIRVLYYPLERMGALHERHVLQVAAPLRSRNALLGGFMLFLGILSVSVTGATFGGAWWLAGRAIRPVHEVIDQAEAIGAASLATRIKAYADTNEYQRLVDVLNTMLGRLEGAFETQRRFTADASHELRSPLTAMRGELELALRRDRDAPEYRRALESALEEVIRLSKLAEDLLILARSDAGELLTRPEAIDAAGVVTDVVARLGPKAAAKRIDLRHAGHGDTIVDADPVLFAQVAWNLIDNAIRFTPPGGMIRADVTGRPEAVLLTVEDSGPGFPADAIDRVFDRFFRADPARARSDEGSGTGLGLAIVRSVAAAHGGDVAAANLPQGGAQVIVRLPRERTAHA